MNSTAVAPVTPPAERTADGARTLRVLHVLWSGGLGGAERAVHQLVREQLRDTSLEPALLFAQARGPFYEHATDLACPVTGLDVSSARALHRLPELSHAMAGYDVHHFHGAEPLLMAASARCRRTRRVYTHRGGAYDYGASKRTRFALTGAILRRFFHALSGNTLHAARCGARLYHIDPARFRVTYNGLDVGLITPQRRAEDVRRELGLDPSDLVLGTAAVLKSWKRIDRLVRAVADIGEPRLRLVVVGDGDDRPRLERLSRDLGVAERVRFAGRQDRPWDYVQIMDVFSLPSMGLESFGNAAVEAMALGLPVLVFSDGGGLVEHIADGETGYVVDGQRELEQALARLMGDPALRARLGERAAEMVRARYPMSRCAAGYRRLYAEAIETTRPRA